ncbi:MAG: N-acetylmuramoyl-L-alanine amidase [Bacilli bacterium]|nr:N-acetylmuramoyl-L-alanine amidase [Bacilli bacterium]MDD4795489.1 N-acetylmuramoyl-L-alanine amidase [Bacilli bacterium]
MKKILFILLIFCLLILTIFKVDANNLTYPLLGKLIVIDPGHGGVDNGASHGSISEDTINLEISLKLRAELEKNGASVILIRDDDYDLSKPNALYRKKSDFDNRIKLINNSNADMYLSIHLNYYSNSKYYGPQIFYTNNFEENEVLAQFIQNELNKNLNTKRDIKKNNNTNYMYSKLNIKGVLIECGFLSNHQERLNLQEETYQEKLTKIIVLAIINYYN